MNRELKKAQQFLTEQKIRQFWKAMTISFPKICPNEGINVDFNKPITPSNVTHIVHILTKCSVEHVGAPIFGYNYEPDNPIPHHVSALTLTKLPKFYVLSYFNPKGKESVRTRKENALLSLLATALESKLSYKIVINNYRGPNLQSKDHIGLCQLFSLFFLYTYIYEVNQSYSKSGRRYSLEHLSDPNFVLTHIQKKHNVFDEKLLFNFWQSFFQSIHNNRNHHKVST